MAIVAASHQPRFEKQSHAILPEKKKPLKLYSFCLSGLSVAVSHLDCRVVALAHPVDQVALARS